MAKKISASDIFQEEDIFLGIRQSAEKTILSFQEIDAEVKKLAGNLKKDLSTADFGNTKGINSFVAATQKANDAKTKSIQIDKVLAQATKDVAAADKALVEIEIKKQKLAQEQIKTNNAIAKSENDKAKATEKAAKAAINEASAYKQLAASTRDLKNQSKELQAEMLALEKAGQKETAAYATLETQFKEVSAAVNIADAELKQIDKTVGDNFRNVGNYEGATKGLKQQLREMTVALQNMESTDPRFRQMTIDAGNLKDTIMDTNAVIKSTAGSAVENLGNGIAKAGKVGIDAFAGMTGAMGLFGIESEGAMQAMLKLQQLAAMSEALQSLGALGDTMTEVRASFVAAASKLGLFTTAKVVDTTVTTTQTVATEAATVATSGLGKAMKALPIIAIIAAIAGLVAMVYNLASAHAEARRQQDMYKNSVEQGAKIAEGAATKEKKIVDNKLKLLDQEIRKREALGEDAKKLQLEQEQRERKILEESKKNIDTRIKYSNKQFSAAKKDSDRMEILLKDKEGNWSELTGLVDKYGARQKGMFDTDPFVKIQDALNSKMTRNAKVVKDLTETQTELNDALFDNEVNTIKAENALKDYNIKITTHKSSVDDLKISQKLETEALEAENEARQKAIDLLKEHNALIDEIQAYNAAKVIEYNVANQIKNIQQTGQYSMDVIQMLIDSEFELQKAILQRQRIESIDAAETPQQVIDAEKKYQFELSKIKTDAAKKTTEINDKLQTEQENFDKNRVDSEKALTEEVKAEMQKRQKTQDDLVKAAADFFIAQSNKKIEQIDKEIAAANTQYTTLQTLAANGNINAKESLAEQQKIINEANAQKAKELKKQQRIKLAESVYSTYNAKVAGGSEHPLLDTIKDTMLLQQFIASLPTFYDGTEDTGKNGNGIDGKGGFHAVLHPNERVIPKSLNEQIGGLSNEALAKMANEYQNGKIIRSNSQIGSSFDTAILVSKIDELTNAIKSKPETNIGIGEITQSVMEIVKSTKQGNTTTYNRYKVRR